jgi:hypothetical protein
LATVYPFKLPVRLLGVTLSSLTDTTAEDSIQDQAQLHFGLLAATKKPAAGGGAAGFQKS